MFFDRFKSSISYQILASFFSVIILALIGYMFAIMALSRVHILQKEINESLLPSLVQVEKFSKDMINFSQDVEAIVNIELMTDIESKINRIESNKKHIEEDVKNLKKYTVNDSEIYKDIRLNTKSIIDSANKIASNLLNKRIIVSDKKQQEINSIRKNKNKIEVALKTIQLRELDNINQEDKIQLAAFKNIIIEMFNLLEQLPDDANSSYIANIQNQYTTRLRNLPQVIFDIENPEIKKIVSQEAQFLLNQIDNDSGIFYIANQLALIQLENRNIYNEFRDKQVALNEHLLSLLETLREESNSRANEVNGSITISLISFFVLAIIAILISILIIYFYVYPKIIYRLTNMSMVMKKIQKGDYKNSIDTKGEDEIALMEQNLNSFKNTMQQKQELHDAMENTVEGISLVDANGGYIYLNDAFAKICGYVVEELIGESWKSIIALEDHNIIQNAYEDMLDKGKTVIEATGIRKNGTAFILRATMIANYLDDKYIGHHFFISDITENKRADDKLKDAYKFQELIKENIPDILFIKDDKYRIIEANNEFLKLYPAEMQDKIIGYTTLEAYNEKEAEEFLYYDKLALEKGHSENEETIQFPDGKQRVLLTKKVRFEDSKHKKYILGLARDISIIKEAEKQLLDSNIELQRFAYVASHDLQEPIRMVSNFTSLLKNNYADQLDETANQYINFAVDGAERMQQLISDLLEYSRVGNQIASYEKVNINDLFDLVKNNLLHEIKESSAKIMSSDLPTIVTNPMLISRVFQNIISNAIKYTNKESHPEINLRYQFENQMHRFSVQDNGIGIQPDNKDEIFEIFKRLHNKSDYSGTGIGLALCRKIIEGFGGKIWVESAVNKGSIFYFTLPDKSL